ncbi:YciI family protein [bacterium]|nr:YciI family protein [bacterium]
MADFMLIYVGGDHNWHERPKEEIEKVMQQWGAWFQELEASGNLRNPGAPLAPGGSTLRKNGSGIATDTTLPEVKELVGGYSIVQADSLAAATELAKGCPFLTNNAGGTIQVRPVMSSPS